MQLFPFSHTQRLSRTPPHSPALSLRKALSRQTPSALRPPETMPPKRKARTEAGPSQTPVRLLAAPARHSARPPRRPCTHATRAHQQRHHTANPARPHCASRAAPARCAHSLVLPTSAQKSPLLSELTMDAFEEVWTKFTKKAIDEARDEWKEERETTQRVLGELQDGQSVLKHALAQNQRQFEHLTSRVNSSGEQSSSKAGPSRLVAVREPLPAPPRPPDKHFCIPPFGS